MVPRRFPLSGAPKLDGLFIDIWVALASIQLWTFLYLATTATIRMGPHATAIVFAVLFELFVMALVPYVRRTT